MLKCGELQLLAIQKSISQTAACEFARSCEYLGDLLGYISTELLTRAKRYPIFPLILDSWLINP